MHLKESFKNYLEYGTFSLALSVLCNVWPCSNYACIILFYVIMINFYEL